eukprot:scaffold111176_cov33-Phaeocystis_antarctica.AAC.1
MGPTHLLTKQKKASSATAATPPTMNAKVESICPGLGLTRLSDGLGGGGDGLGSGGDGLGG